ncbi:MAG: ATP-binding protein [candidate division WOR-3 bacterium]|nr:ATP-binding protein [candidate division WOR-3 bacterium]
MQDLSLHILDIVENSIDAGATRIEIMVDENIKRNLLRIMIKDNGKGIERKELKKILDPFYTTRTVRRVGLGLSLFAQSVKEAEGKIGIKSKVGKGTVVEAIMKYNHIDRRPMGNMCDTIMTLIGTKADSIDFVYKHCKDNKCFRVDTREIKDILKEIPISNPEVIKFLRRKISSGLRKIKAGQGFSLVKQKVSKSQDLHHKLSSEKGEKK